MIYVNFFIIIILPFAIVEFVTLMISFLGPNRINKEQLKDDKILRKAYSRWRAWLLASTFWMLVDYLIVIIPFVANVIVIFLSTKETIDFEPVFIFSVISLAFIIFGYAIKPQQHKKCYRKAYEIIDKEINAYLLRNCKGKRSGKRLIGAISAGERYISETCDVN